MFSLLQVRTWRWDTFRRLMQRMAPRLTLKSERRRFLPSFLKCPSSPVDITLAEKRKKGRKKECFCSIVARVGKCHSDKLIELVHPRTYNENWIHKQCRGTLCLVWMLLVCFDFGHVPPYISILYLPKSVQSIVYWIQCYCSPWQLVFFVLSGLCIAYRPSVFRRPCDLILKSE